MKCQICSSSKLHKVISLGHQPPADNFLTANELEEPETYYPLDVYYCEKCGLVQLAYAVDPEMLFKDYLYNTGTNANLRRRFLELVSVIVKRFELKPEDLVIDIGSNDGTLLEGYLPHKMRVLGIDPSSVAKLALEKNIPTIIDYFDEKVAKKVLKENGKAKVVTATNVFAHVKDLKSFVKGVRDVLDDKGVFITESHHLLKLITEMQYDSIYHEHLRYYSLKPLIHLFNALDMDVFDAEEALTHGGSIRVYACKKGAYEISERVGEMLKKEEKAGLYDKKTYDEFRSKVLQIKSELQEILRKIKKDEHRIFGIGAPAKGSTLLNYCNIGPDVLDCIAETSELKIGKFTPGSHVPIVNEERLFKEQPEYALLLSWNIKDILIPKLREAGFKGKFVIPNPEPQIL